MSAVVSGFTSVRSLNRRQYCHRNLKSDICKLNTDQLHMLLGLAIIIDKLSVTTCQLSLFTIN